MLAAIQKQLATNEIISEEALAKHLSISVDALTPMMNLLIKRGLIEKIISGNCSGSCGCVNSSVQSYRWLGAKPNMAALNIVLA